METELRPYSPPHWAKSKLKITPSKKIKFISSETPISTWNIQTPNNSKIYIKRDDLTGTETSGNKIRKLEFLMADAIAKGCDSVITIGGLQSNHCRSTAAAATKVGLDCYLCLRHSSTDTPKTIDANYLLSRLLGAHVILFTPEQCKKVGWNNELLKIVKSQLEKQGKKPYIIPLGGSNALGSWGYIQAMEEILQQIEREKLKIDDIVVTAGSGGTLVGLALGNYLANTGMRVVGVCSSDDAKYFIDEINEILDEFGISKRTEDICTIVDGFVGKGYGINTPQELQTLTQISENTGVVLDPVYTLKAVIGLTTHPEFKNRRVLFVHTGGIFGLFKEEIGHEWNQLKLKSTVTPFVVPKSKL